MYGLSSSLTLCLASCLPVYLPILAGYGHDESKGIRLSIGFAVGRFAGYFFLGIIVGRMLITGVWLVVDFLSGKVGNAIFWI